MKSVKPGRGPSAMGGIGSVFAALFGIFWLIAASSIGAPAFMSLFGIIFIMIAVVNAVYQFSNATRKNRFSSFDITDENEEPDPLNERFHESDEKTTSEEKRFCPYCGQALDPTYLYCTSCGKKMKD